jgi:hypothetical protein
MPLEEVLEQLDAGGQELLFRVQVLATAGRGDGQQGGCGASGVSPNGGADGAPLFVVEGADGGAFGAGDGHQSGEQDVDDGWVLAGAAAAGRRGQMFGHLVDEGLVEAVRDPLWLGALFLVAQLALSAGPEILREGITADVVRHRAPPARPHRWECARCGR